MIELVDRYSIVNEIHIGFKYRILSYAFQYVERTIKNRKNSMILQWWFQKVKSIIFLIPPPQKKDLQKNVNLLACKLSNK